METQGVGDGGTGGLGDWGIGGLGDKRTLAFKRSIHYPLFTIHYPLKPNGIRDNRRFAGWDRGRMPTRGDTQGSRD